ncbi:MAG: hypothetical protein IH956_05370 [Chloroflexi bacterium]|nr:hypothetical protein [Chloroflexota bacterium]
MDSLKKNHLVQFAGVSFGMLTAVGLVLGFVLSSKIRFYAVDDLDASVVGDGRPGKEDLAKAGAG